MQRKLLLQLVKESYEGKDLNPQFVTKAAEMLSRQDLKQYIKTLKKHEAKNQVTITLANTPKKNIEEVFASIYPNKKITYIFDSSLGAGIRIQEPDYEFEISLKQILEGIVAHVSQL